GSADSAIEQGWLLREMGARFGLGREELARRFDRTPSWVSRRLALVGELPATFDFLGFTLYWGRTRRGQWAPAFKTRKARLRRAISAVSDWCRSHRHLPVKQQHAALVRRINGHCNYFGVNGNSRSLGALLF